VNSPLIIGEEKGSRCYSPSDFNSDCPLHMYSTVPTGSLVTLGGHLRVVLHSDDATASVSADPRRHWRTVASLRRVDSIANVHLRLANSRRFCENFADLRL